MKNTIWQRLFRGVQRVLQNQEWTSHVEPGWNDQIMDLVLTDRFHAKQGRSTARWTVPGKQGKRTLYLKRHYRLGPFRGLLATIWPNRGWSPAFEEWRHLEWAHSQGIKVPLAMAAGESIGPWCRLQSFLAVEELTDMLPLHEAIPMASAALNGSRFQQWKQGLVREMARITRALHGRRHFHKDLYLCHFYISASDTVRIPEWKERVYLIDLHRLAQHRFTRWFYRLKDLAQLVYSSDVPGIDARDRLRFWRLYQGRDVKTFPGKLLRWCVLVKWFRYKRHNDRKKEILPVPAVSDLSLAARRREAS
jgi:hypothetical protein